MKRNLRRWAYAAAGIAVIVAAMILFAPMEESEDSAAPVSAAVIPDPLKQFILEQEQLRSMQISQLDDIINSDRSSEELISSAQRKKMDIAAKTEAEQTIAGILRARGYTDAAASVNEGYAVIMVRAQQAEKNDIARITELVTSQTDITAQNIKIIPIN